MVFFAQHLGDKGIKFLFVSIVRHIERLGSEL